jgi:chitodextrinase
LIQVVILILYPPSNVTGLTVIDAKDGKLNLSWDAATDNVGVDHYEIYRDAILLLNITGTSFKDTELMNDYSYTYTVRVVDAAGNKGGFSDLVSGIPKKTSTLYIPPKTSTPYTPSTDILVEDENNTPIENDSASEENDTDVLIAPNIEQNTPLSQPTITGPS